MAPVEYAALSPSVNSTGQAGNGESSALCALRFPGDAMVPEKAAFVGKIIIVCENHAAFTGRNGFDRMKAENGKV